MASHKASKLVEETSSSDPGYSYITLYPSDISWAADQGLISDKQAQELWPQLESRAQARYTATLTYIAYYSGALLVIASMLWFTSIAYQDPRSLALFWLSITYVASFGYAGVYFWNKTNDETSKFVGGLFTTIAVSISPVATYALMRYVDVIPNVMPHFPEETTVVVAGIVALYYVPFPFITAPITLALYCFAENDLVTLIFGENPTLGEMSLVSVVFGGIEICAGFWIARLNLKQDFNFWVYLFGLSAFCGGLSTDYLYVYFDSMSFGIVYVVINIVILSLSIPLSNVTFMVFGGFCVSGYIATEMWVYGSIASNSWGSMFFGTVLTIAAYYLDLRDPTSDLPFWGFWAGVPLFESAFSFLFLYPVYTSQLFKIFYCVVNIGVALLYIKTQRDVFIGAGSLGVLVFVADEVNIYAPNYAIPIFITALGLALIGLAVYLSTHKWFANLRKRNTSSVELLAEEEL